MKRIIITFGVILLPILALAQTDWANTARYAKANETVTTQPKAVLMGDSITQCWSEKDPSFFPENNFLCRGISGQTTSHMLCRFRSDVIELHPEFVVILAGTNDIALNNGPITLQNIFRNIMSMCELAAANSIKPVLCSVLPCKGYRWRPEVTDARDQIIRLNEMLQEYASQNNFIYIDYHSAMKDAENGLPSNLSSDGCHPTSEGYKIMEGIILTTLQ